MPVITRPPVMSATRRLQRHEAATGFAFVLPSVVGFVVFVLGPLVAAFVIGFTEYDIVTSPEWVGLENFRRLWRDDRLRETYANTVVYVICAVVVINVIGLALAVMVNRRMPGWARTVLRSIYFFPSLIGLTYVSIIWQALFQKDTGVVNHYLSEVGGPRI